MKVYVLQRIEETLDDGTYTLIEDIYGNELQAAERRDKLISINKQKRVYYHIEEYEVKGKIYGSR